MVVCVTGSRSFANWQTLSAVLGRLEGVSAVWHGGARGADALAGRWAALRGLPVRVWPANWPRWGKAAGKRRSAEMVAALPPGSLVVAFTPGALADSSGTAFTVARARALHFSVLLIEGVKPCPPTSTCQGPTCQTTLPTCLDCQCLGNSGTLSSMTSTKLSTYSTSLLLSSKPTDVQPTVSRCSTPIRRQAAETELSTGRVAGHTMITHLACPAPAGKPHAPTGCRPPVGAPLLLPYQPAVEAPDNVHTTADADRVQPSGSETCNVTIPLTLQPDQLGSVRPPLPPTECNPGPGNPSKRDGRRDQCARWGDPAINRIWSLPGLGLPSVCPPIVDA